MHRLLYILVNCYKDVVRILSNYLWHLTCDLERENNERGAADNNLTPPVNTKYGSQVSQCQNERGQIIFVLKVAACTWRQDLHLEESMFCMLMVDSAILNSRGCEKLHIYSACWIYSLLILENRYFGISWLFYFLPQQCISISRILTIHLQRNPATHAVVSPVNELSTTFFKFLKKVINMSWKKQASVKGYPTYSDTLFNLMILMNSSQLYNGEEYQKIENQ